MSQRLISILKRLCLGFGLAGPVVLLQGSVACDPDIALQAGLQFASEAVIFLLDNALVGLR